MWRFGVVELTVLGVYSLSIWASEFRHLPSRLHVDGTTLLSRTCSAANANHSTLPLSCLKTPAIKPLKPGPHSFNLKH